MDYAESYQFIFRNPNWTSNILCGALCLASTIVIPVIGQLAFAGYLYEIMEALHRNGGTSYPDFNISKLSDYLKRALPGFIVGLVAAVIIVPLFFAWSGICFVIPAAAASADDEVFTSIAIGFAILFWLIGLVVIGIGASLILTPLSLRGGLTNNIGDAFKFGWACDFARKTWWETIYSDLFQLAANMLLFIAGLLLFCAGVYVLIPIAWLMCAHFTFQLYRVYLSRGGEPIPLATDTSLPAGKLIPPTY